MTSYINQTLAREHVADLIADAERVRVRRALRQARRAERRAARSAARGQLGGRGGTGSTGIRRSHPLRTA